MTQVYLLAANLFALTALLVGLNNFSRGAQSWRLIPLFLLTASRALIIIVTLMVEAEHQRILVTTLDVLSVLCVAASLYNFDPAISTGWQRLTGLAAGAGFVLTLLVLLPGWPIPPQIHAVAIAVFSAPFILMGLGRVDGLAVAPPLVLATSYFLSLLGAGFAAEVVLLLAYALLIAALHREGLQIYQGRRAHSEAVAQQAINLSQERQRLLEVSEIISAVSGVEEYMAHVARTMAHVTQTDQAALFVLDTNDENRFHLAEIYSPERPVKLTRRAEKTFTLKQFALLEQVLAVQEQRFFSPHQYHAELSILYALWYEDRTGPTLVQPLLVQGYSVGALLLGNPVSHRPIHENDRALCRSLAAQMASMAEAYRRYYELEKRINEALEEAEQRAPVAAEAEAVMPAAVTATVDASAVGSGQTLTHDDVQLLPQLLEEMPANQLAILEAVNEGIVVSDAGGRVRLVNRAAEQILGKSRQELLGQPIMTVYGEIDSGETIEKLASAFSRRNEPLPTFTHTKERAIQGHLIPWRNEAQEWLGIIAVFQDVTHQLNVDQSRHDFILALSRELRAPLTTIRGYSELIMHGEMENYTPAQVYVQQIMHSSVDRMVAVLDNAIQIGAQTRKKVLPQFDDVDVTDVIDEAVQKISSLADLHDLNVTTEITGDLPSITADRQQLDRILLNLLENACYFTPPGGEITVRAWVQGERIGPDTEPELILSVSDTGIGISKRGARRIFEPFYQIPGVLHSNGMGMGLAVVKELVEMHKGKVSVESAEGDGSVFQVALPLRQT